MLGTPGLEEISDGRGLCRCLVLRSMDMEHLLTACGQCLLNPVFIL